MRNNILNLNYLRGKEIVQNAPQLYIDIDIEADGKPGHGSILSLGAATIGGEEFYRELKPSSERWIVSQREFCEQHGLTRERLLDEGVEPKVALSELNDWQSDLRNQYGKSGSVMAAFNASFDYPFLDLAYLDNNQGNPFGVAGYCIKSLATALNPTLYDWKKTALRRLPRDVVPEGEFTHHALEDAKYQQKLHYALIGKIAWRELNRQETHKKLARALKINSNNNQRNNVCTHKHAMDALLNQYLDERFENDEDWLI